MQTSSLFLNLALMALFVTGCAGGPNARSGALAGGLTGGAIGALAGAQHDKSLQGAAIGAVAGTALGNALGDQVDGEIAREVARDDLVRQQVAQRAVTMQDVLTMQANNLGDELIINQVRSGGMARRLTPQDLIALKSSGVSDSVISAMQQAPLATAMIERPRPVVIHDHPWVQPVPVYSCPPGWYGRRPRPRARYGFQVHF